MRQQMANQDATGTFQNRQYWAAVCADGMGSRINAGDGARQAVLSVKSVLSQSEFDMPDKTLVKAIYQHWLAALGQKGLKPADCVTTVLILWGNNAGSFRYLQLGDGVICSTNHCFSPVDLHGFGNFTNGLGLSKRFCDWHVGVGRWQDMSEPNPVLVLMSDGVSDDLTDCTAYVAAWAKYAEKRRKRMTKKALKQQLINWPTPNHQDDKSLVMVFR